MRQRSWKTSVFGVLLAVATLILVLMVFINIHFLNQAQDAVALADAWALKYRCQEVDVRLQSMSESLRQLSMTLNNNVDIAAGSADMTFFQEASMIESIDAFVTASRDIGFMFIHDPDAGVLLMDPSADRTPRGIVAVQDYIGAGQMTLSGMNENKWNLVIIEGVTYFAKTVRLGRYLVGTLCDASRFDDALLGEISGNDVGFLLIYDGKVNYSSGFQRGESITILDSGEVDYTGSEQLNMVKNTISAADTEVVALSSSSVLQPIARANINTALTFTVLFAFLMVALFYLMHIKVVVPTNQLTKAMRHLQAGEIDYRIDYKPNSHEYSMLINTFNNMAADIQTMKISEYEQQLRERESELKQMRTQLKPHFYLNAITTILNMLYKDRNEDIKKYLMLLSDFMRYMMRTRSKTVALNEELSNIRNYAEMQRIKFPNSIAVFIGCQAGCENAPVPFLVVFTVVENAFKHAMNLYDMLNIFVQCEHLNQDDFSGLHVIVEDSGPGFGRETLEHFSANSELLAETDHIGLSNVSRTLSLMYGGKGFMWLSNASPHGARVELFIPDCEENQP